MKDIHEVKDNQLLPFNHVCCRGVAARAGSVQTGSWPEGRARTRPQHHHPVPQGGSFSKKFQPSTGSPPEVHKQYTAWVEQIHHTFNNLSHTESFSSSLTVPAILPGSSTRTGGPLPGQWRTCDQRSMVTPREGARTPTRATSTRPASNAQLKKARPNLRLQSQHQLISTHMQCTRTSGHILTSNWD